jgi:hypothetical protein
MWFVPSWAVGVAIIIIAASFAKGLRGVFRTQADPRVGRGPAESDLAHLTAVLDDVQRRLGELEERADFAERLLAKQRDGERLAPPHT